MIGAAVLLLIPAIFLVVILLALAGADQQAAASCAGTSPAGGAEGAAVDANQVSYIQTIIGVGKTLGIPQQGWTVAVATALDETGIRNLANPAVPASLPLTTDGTATDHDSVGIFQQRPSSGWGTPAQIMNPAYAAEAFYGAEPAGGTTNQGLLEVPGWLGLPVTVAAQDVQHSATPAAYAQYETEAAQLVDQNTTTPAVPLPLPAGTNGQAATSTLASTAGAGCAGASTGNTTLPAGFALPSGTPVAVQEAVSYALAQLGKGYSEVIDGGVGPDYYDCSGLMMMSYASAGISIPRSTYQQYLVGQKVPDASQLEPGDLIFIEGADPGANGAPGHVVMYIGSNLIVQAPYSGQKIQVDPVSTVTSQIVTIQRVVPAP